MTLAIIQTRGIRARKNPIPSQTPLGNSLEGSELLRITIPGEPEALARPRFAKGRFYNKAEVRANQTALRWHVLAAGLRAPERDHWLAIELGFFCATRQRKDLDNLVKMVLDAFNASVWGDDMQIVKIQAEKHLSADEPRTEVVVIRQQRSTKDCQTCGKIILDPKRGWGHSSSSRYCSRPCYDQAQKTGSLFPCSQCGKEVYREPGKYSQKNFFCGTSCRGAFLKGKPRLRYSKG